MVSRWSLDSLAKKMGRVLDAAEMESLLKVESTLFDRLSDALAAKRIWVWEPDGPRSPTVIRESVRFGFFPTRWGPHQFYGFFKSDVFSALEDGPDVAQDIYEEVLNHLTVGETIDAGIMNVEITKAVSDRAVKVGRTLYRAVNRDFVAVPLSLDLAPAIELP